MNVLFMGTPVEATPSLRQLTKVAEVGLVVTRPDRPKGRSRRPTPPPVKEVAEELGLLVTQPASRADLAEAATSRHFDVGVVVAFGMILRPKVLNAPDHGFLNLHFSLLPRWRGAAPVERAIMAGDAETGVSIMQMDEGLDTGPIVATQKTAIHPAETGGDLGERLATMGGALLAETVPLWVAGGVEARTQPGDGATYASRIEASDRVVDTDMSQTQFVNTVRALAPEPAARMYVDEQPHKILRATAHDHPLGAGMWAAVDGFPVMGLADGSVRIEELQPPGKRPMSGEAWLRGHSLPDGRGFA